jgi:hypothetical protein
VVFNRARPDVQVILARIREEHNRWHLVRLFYSDSFGYAEPVPWIAGE